jgi:hypothetical protein
MKNLHKQYSATEGTENTEVDEKNFKHRVSSPKQVPIPETSKFPKTTFEDLVKSRNSIEFVIPAKAGIQLFQGVLDPGFRRGDASRDFLLVHHVWLNRNLHFQFIWDLVFTLWPLCPLWLYVF